MISITLLTVICCVYQKKADSKVSFAKSSNGSFKVTIISSSSHDVESDRNKNCYVIEPNQTTTSNAAVSIPKLDDSPHVDQVSKSPIYNQVMPKENTTESNSKLDQNKMAPDVIITDNPSYNVAKSGLTDSSIYIYPNQLSKPPINELEVTDEMPPKQQTVDSGRNECVNTLYSCGARECNNTLYEGTGACDDYAVPINPYSITVLTTCEDGYDYVGGQLGEDVTQAMLRRSRAESINTLTDRDDVIVSPNPSYGITSLTRSTSGTSYNYTCTLPQSCEDSTDNVVLNRNPSYGVASLTRSQSPNGYDYIAAQGYEVSTQQAVNVHREERHNTTSEHSKASHDGGGEPNHYDMVTSNSYDYVVDEMFKHREYHNALCAGDGMNPDPNETLTASQNGYDYICNNSA